MEGVLLYLCVAERLEYPPAVGAQEVVRHVGVEVQVVRVIQKVSVMNKKISVVDPVHFVRYLLSK